MIRESFKRVPQPCGTPDQYLSGHGESLKDKNELAHFCASRLAIELLSDSCLIREILLILSN